MRLARAVVDLWLVSDMVGTPPALSTSCSAGGDARERARFEARVDRGDGRGCWVWTAYREPKGYGRAWFRGAVRKAHHVALELAGVVVLPGHVTTHVCGNRACVRLEHLEQIAVGESVLRGSGACARNAAKLLCSRGHQLATRRGARSGPVHRVCLTCVRSRPRKRYRRRAQPKQPCAACGVRMTTTHRCRSCAVREVWQRPDSSWRVARAKRRRRCRYCGEQGLPRRAWYHDACRAAVHRARKRALRRAA